MVAWIWLCQLGLENKLLAAIGLDGYLPSGERSAYNPFDPELLGHRPALAWGFLSIRFFGLAVVVAVIEEFFLRGFVLRFVVAQDWWKVPFGTITPLVAVLGTAIPMAMHPGELLASLVWFSMITWLMVRTRNIWDCVVAHGVTNLLLGIYVVVYDQWQLM
ncbi:MAG: CAAX prenyl protease-related protein [Planctomycetes bacterium]|nr:CAAX prenyl protease-related protein [Planctomycetota bacterium]